MSKATNPTKPSDTAYLVTADYGYKNETFVVIAPNPLRARETLKDHIGFLPKRCIRIKTELREVVKAAEADQVSKI